MAHSTMMVCFQSCRKIRITGRDQDHGEGQVTLNEFSEARVKMTVV